MTIEALKILAIDDNADNLITLRAVVRDVLPGTAVVTASSGPQGIAQAQAEDPDVILLDIVMPGMDGYEACRRLKADERTRHIPVVFLTALRGDRESRVRALEAGAEAFLAKPLDEVELTAQIRAMAKIKAANVLARQEQGRLAALVAERTAELERELAERVRAEEALRESEDKFKYVFDHSIVAKSLTLPSGEVNVNQAFADMLGYTRAELQNLKWQDITHPDDFALSQNVSTALLSGAEASLRFKKRYLRRDGGVVWTDLSTSLRRDHEGKPLYFMTAVSDITAQVQAEAALRQEKDRAQEYLDIAGVMLVAFDTAGKVILINQRGTEILGRRQEEIIGQDWFEGFLPLRIRDQVRAVFGRLMAGEVEPGGHYENPVLTAGGEERIVAWHNATLKDGAGRISGILSSGEDITERKRAEDALRASEEKFRTITEQMTDMVFVSDGTGTVTYVSPAAEPLFGFTPAEMQSRPFADFLVETDIPTAAAAFTAAIAAGIPTRNLELRMQRKDGSVFTGELSGTLYQRDDLRGSIGLIRDVTERKRAEDTLREREDTLQKIFNILPIGLWFADKDGRLLRGNPAGIAIWGGEPQVAPAEYGVFKARRLPSGQEIAADDWALAHTIRERVTIVDELLEIDAFDGKKKIILNYTAPVLDEQGAVLGAIVVNQDLTERKQAEDKIQQQLHELKRWYNVTLERETRSLELKHEVNKLLRRLNEPIRYPSAEK